MATHPDFPADPPATYIRPTLLVGVAQPPALPALIDAEALQAAWDSEAEAEAGERWRDAARVGERVVSGLALASGCALLCWMALRIVAAAFAGRL